MTDLSNCIFKVNNIVVDTTLNKLTLGDQSVIIEGRLMSVLIYLSECIGETVSIEELIKNVWSGQIVSTSAVYRVVAQLRKILNRSLNSDILITTVTKKGYRLDAAITLVSDGKSSAQIFSYRLLLSSSAIIILAAFVYLLTQTSWNKSDILLSTNTSAFQPLKVTSVTSLLGQELQPTISADGRYLLFSHSPTNNGNFNLFIRVLGSPDQKGSRNINNQGKTIQLTDEDAIFLSAGWSPDGQQIAYQKTVNKTCNIMLANFDQKNLTLNNHRVFSNCLDHSASSIVWSNDAKRLYYVSNLSGRFEVFEHHIFTQEKRRLASPEKRNSWNYFVIHSPFESKVLILTFNNYKETQFYLYDVDKQTEELIHAENYLINSVAWGTNKNELVFEQADKRLIKINLKTGQRNLVYESGRFISSVSRGYDGKSFVFSTQLQANEDIYLGTVGELPDGTELFDWQQNSSLIETLPEFSHHSYDIAFVSNRTGVAQLWLRTAQGQVNQLTSFESENWFGRLHWSIDDQKILFARGGNIYIYDLLSKNTVTIVAFSVADTKVSYSPSWSFDNKFIYYSIHENKNDTVWIQSMEDLNQSPELYSKTNIRNLLSSPDGRFIYYTVVDQKGLIQLDNTTQLESQILKDLPASSWQSWRVDNEGVYYINKADENSGVYYYRLKDQTSTMVFPWINVMHIGFSFSNDKKYYIRDKFVEQENDIMLIQNN